MHFCIIPISYRSNVKMYIPEWQRSYQCFLWRGRLRCSSSHTLVFSPTVSSSISKCLLDTFGILSSTCDMRMSKKMHFTLTVQLSYCDLDRIHYVQPSILDQWTLSVASSQLPVSLYALLLSPVSPGGSRSVREGLLCPDKDMEEILAIQNQNQLLFKIDLSIEENYHFCVWSEGWSEYQFHEAWGKMRRPSVLPLLQSDDKTLMRHFSITF